MNQTRFNDVLMNQISRIENVLGAKAAEYASGLDLLHNFKNAAQITRRTTVETIGGMMIKHTISIYDMISASRTESYTIPEWDEKITDHINYLILLRAAIQEDYDNEVSEATVSGTTYENTMRHVEGLSPYFERKA